MILKRVKILSSFIVILFFTACSKKGIHILLSNDNVIDLKQKIVVLDQAVLIRNRKKITIKNGTINFKGPKAELFFTNCPNLVIQNVNFDSDGETASYINLEACQNVKIKNNKFYNLGNGSVNVSALVYKDCDSLMILANLFKNIEGKKVARAVKQSDGLNQLSEGGLISNNRFEDIYPRSDADAIYIEVYNKIKSIGLIITGNLFKNIAKRFIKINASGVVIENNEGHNDLSIYSFISFYGSNIKISSNVFVSGQNGFSFYGIDAGSINTKSQSNIVLKGNRLINMTNNIDNKSASFRFASDTDNITITSNYVKGFYYCVTTSFKLKNSISKLVLSNNDIECSKGVELFGSSKGIQIGNNKSRISRNNLLIKWKAN